MHSNGVGIMRQIGITDWSAMICKLSIHMLPASNTYC
uniref:Uncharacterized protein n=1 Tax=Anguilla anguilla TaxID=7936 RepID=A0A0E9PLU2_ANGAN